MHDGVLRKPRSLAMTTLSVDHLYLLTDDQVKAQMTRVFTKQLRYAPSVRETFCPRVESPPVSPVEPDWVDNVAVALVCSSIGHSSFYSFNETVNQSTANNYWQSQLSDSNASAVKASQALYRWAFPTYCQGKEGSAFAGPTFGDYLNNDPKGWGKQLAAHVANPAFINTQILELIATEPDWGKKLNLVLYKL